jgi:uncharacterized protein (DUF2147 family)
MRALRILFLIIVCLAAALADDGQNKLVGVWIDGKEQAHIEIYEANKKFFGKIVWLNEPLRDGKPKKDGNNPDPKLKSTPILGLQLLKDFIYVGGGKWEEGKIYDPNSGKTYNSILTLQKDGSLDVRGYIGFSFIGQSDVWKRVK